MHAVFFYVTFFCRAASSNLFVTIALPRHDTLKKDRPLFFSYFHVCIFQRLHHESGGFESRGGRPSLRGSVDIWVTTVRLVEACVRETVSVWRKLPASVSCGRLKLAVMGALLYTFYEQNYLTIYSIVSHWSPHVSYSIGYTWVFDSERTVSSWQEKYWLLFVNYQCVILLYWIFKDRWRKK